MYYRLSEWDFYRDLLSPSLTTQLIGHYGIYYGISIALLVQSIDPSLFSQLIGLKGLRRLRGLSAHIHFSWPPTSETNNS